MIRIFVYGTLKRGFNNYRRLLLDAVHVGEAVTPPNYTMVSLGRFPGVIHGGDTAIKGELYDINEAQLRRVDSLEGNGSFYTREVIETDQGEAWMYLLPERYLEHKRVNTGEWL